MSYNFGELRKTVAAAGGLAITGLAYVLADETLSSMIPPKLVAVLGAVATIYGVFRAKDDRIADPNKPVQSIQVALDAIAKAQAKIEQDKATVAAQDQALQTALTQAANQTPTLAPSGTTPFSLPPTAIPVPPGSGGFGLPPIAAKELSALDHELIDTFRADQREPVSA
ncbi:hypothetical protein I5G58_gp050 [Mycobacterium phage BirdsNest]|uniref:Uncharacterized protein n=1 Tax=Mycobacterium phage BirdsNest TaxID=2686231 RepID=A0A6B9L6S0_9CAUD|nr:hypothetical protein I5G58_gp050 [Mycobacterium phage BirdsNest]QHB37352.1 hypothetical protein PBI_BIRDSNEST_50 [Mycobacterium phage BirdsNest]